MKYLLLLLVTTSCLLKVPAQVNIDSLEKALTKLGNDTASLNDIVTTGRKYMTVNFDAALAAFKIAEDKLSDKSGDVLHALVNVNIAKANFRIGNFIEATDYYLKAVPFAEKAKHNVILGEVYLGLGSIGVVNKENKKSLEYFEKALTYCGPEDFILKSAAIGNISAIYYQVAMKFDRFISEDKRIDTLNLRKSILYSLQAYEIAKTNNLELKIKTSASNLAMEYTDLGRYDSAGFFLAMLEKLNAEKPSPQFQLTIADRTARLYRAKGDFKNAIIGYKKTIDIAEALGDLSWVSEGYLALAESYDDNKEYKNSNDYYKLHARLNDSLLNVENFETATSIKNIYEKEKKEKQYLLLKASEKQKSTWNKIFAGSVAAILLLSLLAYRNFSNKNKITMQEKELQQQKIVQLEKENKLNAVDAMLKGQEEERGRIAKDLHDGLGGLLSGTKMSFTNLREHVILTEENAVQFDKSLNLLDNTINDLRKVAQNLMPEALIRYGLTDALKDFCHRMESTSDTSIVFHQIGESRTIENTASISIYRIIQELVNNALKHAEAKNILVQLSVANENVSITVEDDGKGFDKSDAAKKKGAGIENLKYRVQYLNGKMDIVTAIGTGTSFNVELKA